MFKSLFIGTGAGLLGLAGAAITPVIVGILGAMGGGGSGAAGRAERSEAEAESEWRGAPGKLATGHRDATRNAVPGRSPHDLWPDVTTVESGNV